MGRRRTRLRDYRTQSHSRSFRRLRLEKKERSVRSSKARRARWLLEQFRVRGTTPIAGAIIEIETSQRLIVTMAGVSRENVSRQRKKLQKARVLSQIARTLQLFWPEDLKQLTINRQL